MSEQNLDLLAAQVAELIVNAKKLVIFTGAGVSTESGIADFRSPGGIWSRYDPEDFTYQKFVADPAARKKHWEMLREAFLAEGIQPNPAHLAIGELHRLGKLDCVITQNVDNLHQRGGVPDEKVLELHGNMHWAVCLDCSQRYPFEQFKTMLAQGDEVPACPACQGILKPSIVFFGEALPGAVLQEATVRASRCDLFIVIGSTLVVYPAAYMPEYALGGGAKLVIINLTSTPLDREAQVLLRAKAGEAMSRIIEQVKQKLT